jgi:GNAT superfamily N-acetyltransferase
MKNLIEESQEHIPTRAEILEVLEGYAKNYVFEREKSDERGICLLEVNVTNPETGEITEWQYIRKELLTSISVAYYDGKSEVPISGDVVAELNTRLGKWEEKKSFDYIRNGDTARFFCKLGIKEVGFISATLVGENTYNIGGLFVDPSKRGQSIASGLVKIVNAFLNKNRSLGKLVNMIQGDAASVYENNGWTKGEFKSHGAYGAYEYTYDGRKK